ncbi:hypothetical protein RHGRI_021298 [Rhododendron griersonianum]|uniref:Long-chain-fatty-acid--CoA ligase n=1 Tax=Rhododendron griersonianum TaxID=479676 RepID=A0AAV6JQ18_9ERIC|nr:hypothetical protein RHGRI_021298 [Rhododendron griersonianum]
MDSTAHRRLKAIQGHLLPSTEDPSDQIQTNQTAGEFSIVVFHHKPDFVLATFVYISRHAVESFQDYKYLGTRLRIDGTVGEYKWMTYGEAGSARSAVGSGLWRHGLSKGARVGLYFINSPEWLIVDHACSAYSYISVPLYDTLGPDAVKYIVNHADIQAIFCVPNTLSALLSFLSEIPSVCLIVVVGGIDEHLPSLPSTCGVKLISYSQLLSQGRSSLQPFCPPKPEDVATICYTSGTTGTPKGVVLTHGNLIASAAGMSHSIKFNSADVYMSYLPLAHIYERANQVLSLYYGVAVGFYQGGYSSVNLLSNLFIHWSYALDNVYLRNMFLACTTEYAGIINAVKSSGALRERLFNAAYHSKKQAIMSDRRSSPMWDRLVFNKIKAKLGGRVRFMGSGASPLSPDVMEFLRICFGCSIIEGYGMTETSCVISIMEDGDNLTGHVGSPNPACEVKLVDVPEMNYTSEDQPFPRGEICVRGPIVFQGYFKDDVQTREVMDDDGWLHTGDIGLWIPGGRLKIIDRKKNIFKLAQGEYIAPEKVENVYAKCRFVSQCFVYGDSLNSCLVAVVSVDPDILKDWAASEGIKYEDLGQLCNDRRARAAVLADMDAIGREAQLRGFEFAKAVTLVLEPFTVENDLLTPTFKRPQAKAYFANAIADMYTEISASDPMLAQ